MKIERVTNITEWINAINPGEVKSAYLPCDKVQSLNCLAHVTIKAEASREASSYTIIIVPT